MAGTDDHPTVTGDELHMHRWGKLQEERAARRTPTADPRAEMHRRIVQRLNTDEWMQRHFGISAHAGDVADAVLELFDQISVEEFNYTDGVRSPGPASRLVLKTAPETM